MIAKRTIISGVVEGFVSPLLVTCLASLGLYLINWWAGILLGILGIILGRLIAIGINRNTKEVIIIGIITSLLVFAGVTWVFWYIFQLRLAASIGGLTAIERAENFIEIIGMSTDTKPGERVIEAFINADLGLGRVSGRMLVRPMCTVTGGIFAGATFITTILMGIPMLFLEKMKAIEKEKQKTREEERQEIWEETKKKKREEELPGEITTKEITEEMITEVRKAIGGERKVSIDWVKKITLYSEEAIIEIAIKKLGMRKENGTLILKE